MTKEKNFKVTDTSATAEYPKREHHIQHNGQLVPVSFYYGRATILPFSVATKFIIDGFIVEDEDGQKIDTPALTNDAVKFQIGKDEVVAKYTELTTESLVLRAVLKIGGEKFVVEENVSREEVILFLQTSENDVEEEPLMTEDEFLFAPAPEFAEENTKIPEFKEGIVVDPESEAEEINLEEKSIIAPEVKIEEEKAAPTDKEKTKKPNLTEK